MSDEKGYEYYKRLVQERGIVLKYPEDCGCLECQVNYAWIEDMSPTERAEALDRIMGLEVG